MAATAASPPSLLGGGGGGNGLCVFDSRRGEREGEEADKVLLYLPEAALLPQQQATVGLCEALITFSRLFSPDAPCEGMEGERLHYVLLECEPHIWMVLVLERGAEGRREDVRREALRAVLQEAHTLFRLFFGPLTALLDRDPSAGSARSALRALLPDYLAGFQAGKRWKLPDLSSGLWERGAAPTLKVDRQTSIEVQVQLAPGKTIFAAIVLTGESLVNALETSFGGRAVKHVAMLYQAFLLWATLPPRDAVALWTYASMRMLSAATAPLKAAAVHAAAFPPKTLQQGPPLSQPGKLRAMFHNASSAASVPATTGPRQLARPQQSDDASPAPAARVALPHPLSKAHPWRRAPGGILTTDAWGSEGAPRVHVSTLAEPLELHAYQHQGLTVLMLLTPVSNGIVPSMIDKIKVKAEALEESMAQKFGAATSTHVQGYRYLHHHLDMGLSRMSPLVKVATLTKDSLVALNQLRAEVDQNMSRRQGAKEEVELVDETAIRAQNNAWLVARRGCGEALYTVMERASDTLLLATEAVDNLDERHFNGALSLG
eukprot:SM000415S15583  [mRNA]  locus=s415:13382:17546:+ [translate_table: standard]